MKAVCGTDCTSGAWKRKAKDVAAIDTTRKWLRDNGYENVVGLIDSRLAAWKAQGKATRRNWWDILAGDEQGRPRTVDGITFPVLRAAQLRQGKPVSPDALCHNPKNRRRFG